VPHCMAGACCRCSRKPGTWCSGVQLGGSASLAHAPLSRHGECVYQAGGCPSMKRMRHRDEEVQTLLCAWLLESGHAGCLLAVLMWRMPGVPFLARLWYPASHSSGLTCRPLQCLQGLLPKVLAVSQKRETLSVLEAVLCSRHLCYHMAWHPS
jgi:hypothetical protein